MLSRSFLFGLFTCTAAWLLFRHAASLSTSATVPVDEAAEKLRQAWADNHTIA